MDFGCVIALAMNFAEIIGKNRKYAKIHTCMKPPP